MTVSADDLLNILAGTELSGRIDLAYVASLAVPNSLLGASRGGNGSGFSFGIVQLDIGNNTFAQSAYVDLLTYARLLPFGIIDDVSYARLLSYNGVQRPDLNSQLSDTYRSDLELLSTIFKLDGAKDIIDSYSRAYVSQSLLGTVNSFLGTLQQTYGNNSVLNPNHPDFATALAAIVSIANRTGGLDGSLAYFLANQPLTLDDVQSRYNDVLGDHWSLVEVGGLMYERNGDNCFSIGTTILVDGGAEVPIESILPGDLVQSYDANGTLVPGRVTRTFRNEVSHLLDVHGLKVTPGHATLCGEGMFKGRHVPIIDILLSDGALVRADGSLIRMAINAPVGSVADAFVKVAVAATPEDMRNDTLTDGEMRVGTLLFDREGMPVSVLDCLTAEGYAFDPETGLIAKPGEAPHPLFWFGRLPRPEDYILTRSQETLEGILTDGEWEGSRPQLIEGRLRQTKVMRVN